MLRCFGLTVEPFLFFQGIVLTSEIFTLPQLVVSTVCWHKSNHSRCPLSNEYQYKQENEIETEAAQWMMIFLLISLGLAFISVLFIGPLADIVGKRKIMLVCPALTLCQSIVYLVLSLVKGYHVGWLLIPVVIPTLLGGNQGAVLLALAYKSDITTEKQRTRGISTTEGFIYLSVGFTGLVTGLLQQYIGFHAVFIQNIIASLLCMIYVKVSLPDEHTIEPNENQSLLERNTQDGKLLIEEETNFAQRSSKWRLLCFDSLRFLLKGKRGHTILLYLLLLFLSMIPAIGVNYIGVLFFGHSPIGFHKEKLGFFIAATYCSEAAGAWIVVPLFQRYLKCIDMHLVLIGFTFLTLAFIIIGSAVAPWMLYINLINVFFGIITLPVLRSLISKQVPDDYHGAAFALIEICDVLASLVSSSLGNLIYSKTVSIFPGIVMYVFAFASGIGLIISIVISCKQEEENVRLEEE